MAKEKKVCGVEGCGSTNIERMQCLIVDINFQNDALHTEELLRSSFDITNTMYRKVRGDLLEKKPRKFERKTYEFGIIIILITIKVLHELTIFSTGTSCVSLEKLFLVNEEYVLYYLTAL